MSLRAPAVVETDVLVLGGGLAGHRAAIAAREAGAAVDLVYLGSGASPSGTLKQMTPGTPRPPMPRTCFAAAIS